MSDYKTENINGGYTVYKDKPLVRHGNMFCYGDMSDDYVLYLMVLTEKEVNTPTGTDKVPDLIIVQVTSTDESKSPADRLVKQFEKNGLYDAIDVGLLWLNKFNKK
ncbi:MAG: hypothetical protein J6Z80_05440 [Clostridia bacterium]|nr:hypothetical protein [Clostridia bacterium]